LIGLARFSDLKNYLVLRGLLARFAGLGSPSRVEQAVAGMDATVARSRPNFAQISAEIAESESPVAEIPATVAEREAAVRKPKRRGGVFATLAGTQAA
jgi:hypothetical protein